MLSIYPDIIAASAGWKGRASSSVSANVTLASTLHAFAKGTALSRSRCLALQAMEILMFAEFTGLILFLWIVSAPVLVIWLISNWADRRPTGYYKRTEQVSGANRKI